MLEGHIHKRYDGELKHLHYLTLEMGEMVIAQLRDALQAFKDRDIPLAHKIVSRDDEVDRMEVKTDEEINKLIARRCPVSADLRMVIAVSKSVSDLERIGDEAVRIAGLVIELFDHGASDSSVQMLRDVHRMGEMALDSLQNAVGLFDVWDDEMACRIIQSHREMEDEFQSDLRRLITYIMEDSRNIGHAISAALVIKALERIGHHAQNLAEYVVFQLQGVDIRNQQPQANWTE